MSFIPLLTKSAKTDPGFPPHCSQALPRRAPPGPHFLWTLSLAWKWAKDDPTPTLPAPFSRDLGDINNAIGGDGPAYRRASDLQEEVQATVHVRVGAERIEILKGANAIVKRIEVSAADGHGACKVLLCVEVPQKLAGAMLDCIDADVDVSIVTNEELNFPPRESDPEAGDHERGDPDGDADPPSNGDAPQETLTQARARRRKGTATEPATTDNLPPEA